MDESAVLRSRFGDRARALLDEAELSTTELSVRSDLPLGRIEAILDGSYERLSLREMSIIAAVLDTPLFDLLAPSGLARTIKTLEKIEQRRPRNA